MNDLVDKALKFYDSPERIAYSNQRIKNTIGSITEAIQSSLDKKDFERDKEVMSYIDEVDYISMNEDKNL